MEKTVYAQSSEVNLFPVSPMAKGYVVITFVLMIWTGFALSIRSIGASPLATADVALLRFLVPVILLLPFTHRYLHEIRGAKALDVLLILLGGVPFFFVASHGASLVPAAYVGTVLAGTPPFFVAVLGWLFYQHTSLSGRVSAKRIAALMMIVMGVVTMIVGQLDRVSGEFLQGVAVLLSASLIWAIYTIRLKRSGLSPIAVTIMLSWCSLAITLALILSGSVTSHLGAFAFQDALPFILIQGFCVGLLSTVGYSYAVRQLGSAQSSTIGSLSPGLTALVAVPVFGESLTIAIVGGICLTVAGVILSNRV
ncbi:DMT family transporter [Vibrio sp. S9_S30]|uniref:DMT family transporter n=1 Tax=Vibrio sp. S9_S30 TaxID=2720226 RepID=UPI001681201A|nr:DMT family transporter [Vibrio sp. S9_S30]MBD1558851.1 DMT family transporter [Vibrio sp. S9_S30]